VALGAVMRKLLVLMRAVVKADHDWVPTAPSNPKECTVVP
jgi:hypothetical protein